MKTTIKEQYLVSTFFTFFLVHSSQTGLALLGFQDNISKNAQQDAWVSVILTGIVIHFILWLIYKILDEKHPDLMAIHHYCYGKVIGNCLSFFVLLYFLLQSLTVFWGYIEIIQVWVYPTLKTWQLGIVLGILIYYLVSGGFRLLTGFSFWGVVLPSFLLILIYFPIKYAKTTITLLPILNHSIGDILLSAKASTLLFLGFEWILIYYPFIKDANKSQKWAQFGTLYSTILYLIITLISFIFYNQEALQHTPWPTLKMVKIVHFPFVERFEYIFIFIWLLVIISPLCISIWACTRITRRLTRIPPKISLFVFLIMIVTATTSTKDFRSVEKISTITSEIGFYFIYTYIPLLFLIKHIKMKRNKSF
ncbi:GerAB/ArcD/ProY family transporter [Fictibacillus barbaricus]|uniref:GerAB/ArcD/ProY family transporter n=1 Tax=Fictibacillus barbaricus TaxID=182136 RepID=A0ABS2ZH40_9BACL|nr:GerAB/ArcD/ProY family transporter [Fictibacillus barbaricus]MBN3546050.1 GerAB/ArcD/ProY family transporter [Fictibacillus barbaricus]GGB58236.1 germination protein GerB [Fictibacillus barbaricus]